MMGMYLRCFSLKRFLTVALLSSISFCFSGCVLTNFVTARAQGRKFASYRDPKQPPPFKPNPAYYALLPFAVPLDVVTFPIQFLIYSRGGIPNYEYP